MKSTLLIVFGCVIALILPILALFYSEEIIVGEKLCVDGSHSKNLEGIMCEDIEYEVLGISMGLYTILLLIFAALGLAISQRGAWIGESTL